MWYKIIVYDWNELISLNYKILDQMQQEIIKLGSLKQDISEFAVFTKDLPNYSGGIFYFTPSCAKFLNYSICGYIMEKSETPSKKYIEINEKTSSSDLSKCLSGLTIVAGSELAWNIVHKILD